MSNLISPIKISGGKKYLVNKLLEHIPTSPILVEGYSGGLNYTINSPTKHNNAFIDKIAFDRDNELINFWVILQRDGKKLTSVLEKVVYSEENFIKAKEILKDGNYFTVDPFDCAKQYLIRRRMSRGSDDKTFGWSDRLRRKMPEYISAWLTCISFLPEIIKRIENITFDCGNFINLMDKHNLTNNPNCLVYADPPYCHDTRSCKRLYKFEMPTYRKDEKPGEEDTSHEQLFKWLARCDNNCFLSGYDSPAYHQFSLEYLVPQGKKLRAVFTKEVSNNMGQTKKKSKRTEVLWAV